MESVCDKYMMLRVILLDISLDLLRRLFWEFENYESFLVFWLFVKMKIVSLFLILGGYCICCVLGVNFVWVLVFIKFWVYDW